MIKNIHTYFLHWLFNENTTGLHIRHLFWKKKRLIKQIAEKLCIDLMGWEMRISCMCLGFCHGMRTW